MKPNYPSAGASHKFWTLGSTKAVLLICALVDPNRLTAQALTAADAPARGATDAPVESPQAIVVRPGEIQRLSIARHGPNRLVTPFVEPVLITQAQIEWERRGRVLYVQPTSDQPIAGFLTEHADHTTAISVLLEPVNWPVQDIELTIAGHVAGASTPHGATSDYEARLVSIMRRVAQALSKDGLPAHPPVGQRAFYVGALLAQQAARHRIDGQIVDVYRVMNTADHTERVDESRFHTPGVRAVAAYPNTELAPGGETIVMVIADG